MPDIETLSHTTWDCKYHVVLGVFPFFRSGFEQSSV
jgi:hypothetical protein